MTLAHIRREAIHPPDCSKITPGDEESLEATASVRPGIQGPYGPKPGTLALNALNPHLIRPEFLQFGSWTDAFRYASVFRGGAGRALRKSEL